MLSTKHILLDLPLTYSATLFNGNAWIKVTRNVLIGDVFLLEIFDFNNRTWDPPTTHRWNSIFKAVRTLGFGELTDYQVLSVLPPGLELKDVQDRPLCVVATNQYGFVIKDNNVHCLVGLDPEVIGTTILHMKVQMWLSSGHVQRQHQTLLYVEDIH